MKLFGWSCAFLISTALVISQGCASGPVSNSTREPQADAASSSKFTPPEGYVMADRAVGMKARGINILKKKEHFYFFNYVWGRDAVIQPYGIGGSAWWYFPYGFYYG